MKRYIHSTRVPIVPKTPESEMSIYCGVTIDAKSGLPKFNFINDNNTDVLSLRTDTSGEYDEDGVKYIYAYSYTINSDNKSRSAFRNYLKGKLTNDVWYDDDVEDFVEYGVLKLDMYAPLSDIGCIVDIKSTSTPALIDVIRGYLVEHIGIGTEEISLIKAAYRDVEFDADKAADALRKAGKDEWKIQHEIQYTLKKFNGLKKTGELFQMKRFVPIEIREGFTNYLKFANDHQRDVYMSLQGTNVLIYDDFITSGSTVKEIVRLLRSIHDKNTLTVFILVKQH